jgi:hypothetical protein
MGLQCYRVPIRCHPLSGTVSSDLLHKLLMAEYLWYGGEWRREDEVMAFVLLLWYFSVYQIPILSQNQN